MAANGFDPSAAGIHRASRGQEAGRQIDEGWWLATKSLQGGGGATKRLCRCHPAF